MEVRGQYRVFANIHGRMDITSYGGSDFVYRPLEPPRHLQTLPNGSIHQSDTACFGKCMAAWNGVFDSFDVDHVRLWDGVMNVGGHIFDDMGRTAPALTGPRF